MAGNQLAEIEQAIERSRVLLTLGDDWDGEGTPGYLEPTWTRAITFLRELVAIAPTIERPGISGADHGSIDLYWYGPPRTLLMNFDADPSLFPTVSGGDKANGTRMFGEVGVEYTINDIAAWLISGVTHERAC